MSRFYKNDYWEKVIQEVELKSQLRRGKHTINNIDYAVALPEKLRNRVKKIIPYDFDEYDRNVYIEDSDVDVNAVQPDDVGGKDSDEEVIKKPKKKDVFNESTCSEIVRLDNEFPKFDIKIDIPQRRKLKAKKVYNWCSSYVCKARKERVCWDSKIYDMERGIWEKTLDEQAEELMDASAERFTEWINALGSNQESDISKQNLKNMFSIEGERTLQASIQTDPKEVKAIAKTVADKWNLPEMAIELKYENYVKKCLKDAPKNLVTVAFGRTVPLKERPWVPTEADVPITTVFPKEILTGKRLFKGITHLRSTKGLIEYLRNHPNVEKPEYLVRTGQFVIKKRTTVKHEVPLYELLKLTY